MRTFSQFELDFHLNSGSVSGRVDIDNLSGPDGGLGVEQGFVTYTLPKDILPDASITAGRFLSSLGFETAEPTGLYQSSVSEGIPYPAYQNGVAVALNPDDKFGIYAAVLSGVWDVIDTDVKDPGFEAQVSVRPVEQVTAKVGFAVEDIALGNKEETRSELNAWASFVEGPLTIAGEIDVLSNWPSSEEPGKIRDNGIHYLGMANVSLKDVLSAPVALTARFSGIKLDTEDASTEITVSPSYAPTDSWILLGEFKRRIDAKETIVAVESLFTF